MATQQINGSPVTRNSTKNYGGIVKTNGEGSAPVSVEKVVLDKEGVMGSVVINGLNTDKALSAGTFAFNNEKPVGMKLSQELSGVPNDFLLSGSNDVQNIRSIQYQQVQNVAGLEDGVRTVQTGKAIREGKWDMYSAKFEPGYPQVSVDAFKGSDNASGDKAAKVTRKNPGDLVYKLTKGVPVTESYDKKTN